MKKEYSNDDLTVVWRPGKCIHAAECVKALPEVYKPNDKPWINIENATTDALKAQIEKCPSGALTYYMNNQETTETEASTETMETVATKVQVMKNGPLLVSGDLNVIDADGNSESKKKTTAFCRCGQSGNQPYCDGTHNKVGFVG